MFLLLDLIPLYNRKPAASQEGTVILTDNLPSFYKLEINFLKQAYFVEIR